mgnify:CR=1 FL=1
MSTGSVVAPGKGVEAGLNPPVAAVCTSGSLRTIWFCVFTPPVENARKFGTKTTGVAIETPLDRHLYACDEMSGFIAACVYVRPSKSVLDLEVKSVLKKVKEKSFAAPVPREDLVRGAELVGLPIEEHIGVLIEAFRARASELGL